jgi:type II secretory pathway predicted ATPase ExeA
MTKTATLTPTLTLDKPTDLLAAFDFHAVPFTREITTDYRLRLPFLDEALAGRLSAALARMPATLIASAGTGKTALLRRLCRGLPEARYHVHDVEVEATGLSRRGMCREIAPACSAGPAGSYPMRVRRPRPRRRARRRS